MGTDDEGFSLPPSRHTARKNYTKRNYTPIETRNLFELQDTDKEETPPPIVVHTDEITPYKLECITAGNKKERTTTKKTYQQAYKSVKTPFYTHEYGKPPVIKLTMKGLPSSITVQQVYDELMDRKPLLREMRYLDKLVIQDGVKKRIELPIHILTFNKTTDMKTRLKEDLGELFGIQVRLENYRKPTGGTQCFNCQGFGHIAEFCVRATKYVRCSREHRVTECTQTTPKCSNCNEKHAASFRQCPAFRKYLKARQQPTIEKTTPKLTLPTPPPKSKSKSTTVQNINPPSLSALPTLSNTQQTPVQQLLSLFIIIPQNPELLQATLTFVSNLVPQ
ncbi:hypothetical protein L9F63_006824 [Diploptera punctata]|uniref:Gag-like protein n=1 Tax=Diploptera punctata TaxID=6984 RepID=A0AAD7Z9B1_DIPPU|nr:hypothetical protein L9F63_006824 [Diploptera punctata]